MHKNLLRILAFSALSCGYLEAAEERLSQLAPEYRTEQRIAQDQILRGNKKIDSLVATHQFSCARTLETIGALSFTRPDLGNRLLRLIRPKLTCKKPRVLHAALRALGKLGAASVGLAPTGRGIPDQCISLLEEFAKKRAAAIEALADMGVASQEYAHKVLPLITSSDAFDYLDKFRVIALRDIATAHESLAPSCIDFLEKIILNPDTDIRRQITKVMGEICKKYPAGGINFECRRILTDYLLEDPDCEQDALEAFEKIGTGDDEYVERSAGNKRRRTA